MKKIVMNQKNVLLIFGIVIVVPLLSLMNVQMSVQFGAVIDCMQIASDFIRSLLGLIVIMVLTYFLDKIFLSFFLTRLSCSFVTSLHRALICKFYKMNYSSFLKRNPTRLFQICSKDIFDVQEFSIERIIRFIISLITGLLAAIELGSINIFYPFVAMLIYAFSVIIAKPIGRMTKHYSNDIRESEQRLTRLFFDLVDHFALLKSFGKVGNKICAFEQENDTFNETTVRSTICLNFYKTLTRVINSVVPVVIVYISIPGFARGTITAGQLVTAVSLVSILCGPIQNFGDIYLSIKRTWFKIKEMDEVIRENNEQQAEEIENLLHGDISFNNISYRINDVNILSNVSFCIPYKKKTAIVGKTGSGKSTTMSLLSGLLTGTEGSLFVGGKKIVESNRGALLKSVSSIPSTTYLVNDTLRNNLQLGDVNSEVLDQVIKSLGIDKVTMSLPNGYDTFIGPTGVQLSGGQKKLIGLARGLSVNRNYFLLDEVTTGLDDQAVEKVMSYLLEMDQTIVLITHNLKYIERMDHIILLDNGQVIASGTYEEILEVWGEVNEA